MLKPRLLLVFWYYFPLTSHIANWKITIPHGKTHSKWHILCNHFWCSNHLKSSLLNGPTAKSSFRGRFGEVLRYCSCWRRQRSPGDLEDPGRPGWLCVEVFCISLLLSIILLLLLLFFFVWYLLILSCFFFFKKITILGKVYCYYYHQSYDISL